MHAPSPRAQLLATEFSPSGNPKLRWDPNPGTTCYDVVRGVLSKLRASERGFTFSVEAAMPRHRHAAPPVGGGGENRTRDGK